MDEHTVAATAWDAAVEVAEDKKRESDEALDGATTQQEQLQEALNCARKVLKEHTAVVKKMDGDLCTEQCGLEAVEAVRESLEFLQEYVAPEPEEQVAESEDM